MGRADGHMPTGLDLAPTAEVRGTTTDGGEAGPTRRGPALLALPHRPRSLALEFRQLLFQRLDPRDPNRGGGGSVRLGLGQHKGEHLLHLDLRAQGGSSDPAGGAAAGGSSREGAQRRRVGETRACAAACAPLARGRRRGRGVARRWCCLPARGHAHHGRTSEAICSASISACMVLSRWLVTVSVSRITSHWSEMAS